MTVLSSTKEKLQKEPSQNKKNYVYNLSRIASKFITLGGLDHILPCNSFQLKTLHYKDCHYFLRAWQPKYLLSKKKKRNLKKTITRSIQINY